MMGIEVYATTTDSTGVGDKKHHVNGSDTNKRTSNTNTHGNSNGNKSQGLFLQKLFLIPEPTVGFQMRSIFLDISLDLSRYRYRYCVSGVTAWNNRYTEYDMYVVTGGLGDIPDQPGGLDGRLDGRGEVGLQEQLKLKQVHGQVSSSPSHTCKLYGVCLGRVPRIYPVEHSPNIPSNIQDRRDRTDIIENQNKNKSNKTTGSRLTGSQSHCGAGAGALQSCIVHIPVVGTDTGTDTGGHSHSSNSTTDNTGNDSQFNISICYDILSNISSVSTSLV